MEASYKSFKVNKKFLLNTLNPTSEGTKWYDPPPENIITDRQIGRILLQFHQVAEKIDFYGNKKNLKFIDIGTGNGILPELISKYCKCKISHGIDPYEDGEHTTSWPTGTRKKLIDRISFSIDSCIVCDLCGEVGSTKTRAYFYSEPNAGDICRVCYEDKKKQFYNRIKYIKRFFYY